MLTVSWAQHTVRTALCQLGAAGGRLDGWPIFIYAVFNDAVIYRGADKSLARPGRKQARKHVGDARDFDKIEMRAVIKFLFLQGKSPKEIYAILTETLACFLPGRAKDFSALL